MHTYIVTHIPWHLSNQTLSRLPAILSLIITLRFNNNLSYSCLIAIAKQKLLLLSNNLCDT